MRGSQHPAPIYICMRVSENVSLAHSAWSFFPVVVVKQTWAEVTHCQKRQRERQSESRRRRRWRWRSIQAGCCHRKTTPPAQSENHRGEQGEAAVNCRGRCRCMQARECWMLSDSLIDVMSKVRQACLVLPWNISCGTDRPRWWSAISCHVLLCTLSIFHCEENSLKRCRQFCVVVERK